MLMKKIVLWIFSWVGILFGLECLKASPDWNQALDRSIAFIFGIIWFILLLLLFGDSKYRKRQK